MFEISWIQTKIMDMATKIVPSTTLDRLVIERRRRINKITGYYPHAFFLAKEKSDKKYCVVRYSFPNMALIAAGIQYIFCYHQLAERGYIPIIDIENDFSFKQGRVGEHNIWDVCFKQPISAEEAAKKPYVLVTGELFSYSDDPRICLDLNGDSEDHYVHVRKKNFREYYAKANKYTEPIWQVKDEILAELDEEIWNKVCGHRVLGVFLREDFSKDVSHKGEPDEAIYRNHPLLPGVKEVIESIRTQLNAWKYDFIFLSTVYQDSVEKFKEAFGNKVIYIERDRALINDEPSYFSMNEREVYEDHQANLAYYENKSKTYLKEIIALSRCNYLIGGPSSGMAAALVMNGGKYDDIFILEDAREIKRY